MNNETTVDTELTAVIESYVKDAPGLNYNFSGGVVSIHQKEDWKTLKFDAMQVRDVLKRTDRDGKEFIQVNFNDNSKVLVTENLVGFKPFPIKNLDLSKLPKVVTSPDCMSVFEAIDDCLREESIDFEELDTLKRVFSAIIRGGELVGFDMEEEKGWLNRLVISEVQTA